MNVAGREGATTVKTTTAAASKLSWQWPFLAAILLLTGILDFANCVPVPSQNWEGTATSSGASLTSGGSGFGVGYQLYEYTGAAPTTGGGS